MVCAWWMVYRKFRVQYSYLYMINDWCVVASKLLLSCSVEQHSYQIRFWYTRSHTCRHATIKNKMVRYELYRTVHMCTLYIVQKNVSPLMNCVLGWHTLSFAFVIIPRAVKSSELVTIHYLSFRSCFLCAVSHVHCTHTRSWVYKYDIKNENRSIIHYPYTMVHTHTHTTENHQWQCEC